MNTYELLAEQMLLSMDKHRHMPPEPVSGTIRGEMAVLHLLSQEEHGMHAGAISCALRMTTSRIAAVLNSLEKKNMIVRLCDHEDKRRVVVTLTETGKQTCLKRRSEAKAHLISMLMRLSEEDAATFVRLADQLFSIPCTDLSDKEI